MSEVIETFIRQHPGATENESFEGFLKQDRIRAWVGDDAGRKERLRREFARVWTTMEAAADSGPTALARPAPPVPLVQTRPPEPSRQTPVPPLSAPHPARVPAGEARHLQVLCTNCESLDVWAHGGEIRCRHCDHTYDNMLDLVPVQHVGFFSYVFGEGHMGWIAAGGLALLLLLLYGVIRWV